MQLSCQRVKTYVIKDGNLLPVASFSYLVARSPNVLPGTPREHAFSPKFRPRACFERVPRRVTRTLHQTKRLYSQALTRFASVYTRHVCVNCPLWEGKSRPLGRAFCDQTLLFISIQKPTLSDTSVIPRHGNKKPSSATCTRFIDHHPVSREQKSIRTRGPNPGLSLYRRGHRGMLLQTNKLAVKACA